MGNMHHTCQKYNISGGSDPWGSPQKEAFCSPLPCSVVNMTHELSIMYMCACTYTYIQMCIDVYTHICIYIHTFRNRNILGNFFIKALDINILTYIWPQEKSKVDKKIIFFPFHSPF